MITNEQAIRGAEKAAIVMLAAGETHSVDLFTRLADSEIKEISEAMARLERVNASVVESVLNEFASQAPADDDTIKPSAVPPAAAPANPNFHNYAGQYGADDDLVPTRSVWSDLDHIDPDRLARYLENEHPQTAAVVLARLDRSQAATVLSKFQQAFTADIVDRMLSADSVKDEILASLEQTLRREFVDQERADGSSQDSLNTVVELLDQLDPDTADKFLGTLSQRNQSALKRVRGQRFAFEDLEHLNSDDLSRVAARLKPSQLALALKGASDSLRDHVLATFPKRVGLSIEAEMASRGPVRLRDVDAAQAAIADAARLILGKHTEPTRLTA